VALGNLNGQKSGVDATKTEASKKLVVAFDKAIEVRTAHIYDLPEILT
jgi:hypothetical protein